MPNPSTVLVVNTMDRTYRGRHCGNECDDGIDPGETAEVSEEAAAYLVATHGFARVVKPTPKKRTRQRSTRGASPE
ncbi:hypothetical protein LCGC14_0436670 [marine sediment metagenome]|uniref:Uncharacterized protein n=1 Tax=marine sediment metagenome TaxID=412755 RepID=A0A0F9VVV3_9ZZZZ